MPDISLSRFLELFKSGFVVDARKGGLVIGRSHDEGNIYMIHAKDNGFVYASHMEGGEYIVNYESAQKHWDRILFINSHKESDKRIGIDTLRKSPLLLTQAEPMDKFLLIDERGQYIIEVILTFSFV